MVSERILAAASFATKEHLGQTRKDGETPYISHLLTVGLILSRVTQNEDIIVAGILHDVVEDTGTTVEEIEELFGEKVAGLVSECTEEKGDLTWQERKTTSLEKIGNMSREAALIKSADILQNTYELAQRIREGGTSILANFNASIDDKLKFDRKRLAALRAYHPNPLLAGIDQNLETIERLLDSS